MLEFVKTNALFFIGFILYLVVGGILLFNIDQGDAIIYFSDHRTAFGDLFFKYFTKMGEEPIYILLVSIFLFIRIRYAILIPLTGVLALGFSAILKYYFSHPRPFVFFNENGWFDQLNLVEGVKLYTGATSFPSGHTTSAFAVFALVAFLFARKKYLGLLMLICAILVALSRIYLIQHFLKDVYLGAILGVSIAALVFFLQNKIEFDPSKWWDKSFNESPKKA